MSSQTFNISLDKELVKKVDVAAKGEYSSRSDYIRKSVINQLKVDSSKQVSELPIEYDQFKAQYGQTLKNLKDR